MQYNRGFRKLLQLHKSKKFKLGLNCVNIAPELGQIETNNSDAMSILEEAQSIVEGQTRQTMPEPPSTTTIESILQEREKI